MDTKLNHAMHTLAEQYHPPVELKQAIMNKISNTKKSNPKVKMLISVAIIVIMIPMVAFIRQFFYADQLYGSYSQLNSFAPQTTIEEYQRLDNKLLTVFSQLGQQLSLDFVVGVKELIQFKIKHGDKHGALDFTKLSPTEYEKMYAIFATVQPYFDQLNGMKASNKTLTEVEFKSYIDAILLQESISAKSNVDFEEVSYTRILPELEQQYEEARLLIAELESKLSK